MKPQDAQLAGGYGRRSSFTGTEMVQPMIGNTPVMLSLGELIQAVARRHSTVLVCGESGTGKELVARRIHAASTRAAGAFVPVDCSTLRDTLFESQLFGHAKGAFTGAEQATVGFFRAADGGTLFLDEIGELDLQVQARLLRAMQERAVVPLGSIRPVPVDVRVIAATHRDLPRMVQEGKFRADLYYRLHVVVLQVPPLRARRADVPELARHFIQRLARQYGEEPKEFAAPTLAILQAHDWPGNVRELANAVEHAYVLAPGATLMPEDFPLHTPGLGSLDQAPVANGSLVLAEVEREVIARALRETKGNQGHAARLLQIDRRRLYRKIQRYGLDPRGFRE